MNSNRDLIRDIKTRRFLADELPDLLEKNRQAIGSWLSRAGGEADLQAVPKDRIYLICPIAVFEDVAATPALGQVLQLALPELKVIVALPTEASLECFQANAERQDLHQVVTPVLEKDLQPAVDGLETEAVLCLVPRLSVLATGFIAALKAVLSDEGEDRFDDTGAGVCRAKAWMGILPRSQAAVDESSLPSYLGKTPVRALFGRLVRLFGAKSPSSDDLATEHVSRVLNGPDAMILPFVGKASLSSADKAIYSEAFEAFESGSVEWEGARDVPVVTEENETYFRELDDKLLPLVNAGEQGVLDISTGDTRQPDDLQLTYRQDLGIADQAGNLGIVMPLRAIGTVGVAGQAVFRTEQEVRVSRFHLHVPPQDLQAHMVTCYLNRGGGGNAMIRNFAKGIGCELRYAEDETGYRPGVPIVWGVLRGSDTVVQYAKDNNQYFFYIDHAYFSRGHGVNYRITRNGYEAGPIRECPPDRLSALDIEMQSWNRDGSVILVCPPTDYFMNAHDCHDWLEMTLATLKSHTDREIVVRVKPQPGETVEPIEDVFRRSFALVTHSSNIAIEAAIAGVPVFVSETSAAAPVGRTDFSLIENPVYPDRTPWLQHLAYNQYSMTELGDGTAWRMLREFETRPFV
ncbi:hypothetical protein [uncultured Roseibium sp.]|uniref:hypothetical protein n=1 Tax=uncultured Roseibium sp. TaxID=1936171 RepID=UPI0032174F43